MNYEIHDVTTNDFKCYSICKEKMRFNLNTNEHTLLKHLRLQDSQHEF